MSLLCTLRFVLAVVRLLNLQVLSTDELFSRSARHWRLSDSLVDAFLVDIEFAVSVYPSSNET